MTLQPHSEDFTKHVRITGQKGSAQSSTTFSNMALAGSAFQNNGSMLLLMMNYIRWLIFEGGA